MASFHDICLFVEILLYALIANAVFFGSLNAGWFMFQRLIENMRYHLPCRPSMVVYGAGWAALALLVPAAFYSGKCMAPLHSFIRSALTLLPPSLSFLLLTGLCLTPCFCSLTAWGLYRFENRPETPAPDAPEYDLPADGVWPPPPTYGLG